MLTQIRSVCTAYLVANVLIGGVVVLLLSSGDLEPSVGVLAPAIAVMGMFVVSRIAVRATAAKLRCSSLQELAHSYRARWFLRLAFTEACALIGFAMFIVTVEWWLYLLGAVFATYGIIRIAPTGARLEREQAERPAACPYSLQAALALPPDTGSSK